MDTKFCFIFTFSFLPIVLSVNRAYLTTSCNQRTSFSTGIALQSSTALTYSNSMNCIYTVSVPTGYRVVAVFRRFELEGKLNGNCVDYVGLYDGASTSASLLQSELFCGSQTVPTNLTSTGTDMTIEMVTDTSGVYRGFDLMLSAFTTAPCSGDQFSCSNGLCISSSLACDYYNQCGDESDEASCTASDLSSKQSNDNSALVAGLAIGLGSFVIIAVLVDIYIYRQYRWKLFLKDPLPVIQQWDNQSNYPLTRKYYKTFKDDFQPRKIPAETDSDINHQDSSEGSKRNSLKTHSFA